MDTLTLGQTFSMKKFVLILMCSLFTIVGKSQISIFGGVSDVRTSDFSYVCPTVGVSVDRLYVSALYNFKTEATPFFSVTSYNVFGANVGYKLYLTKKIKIIPTIGIISSKRIIKNWVDWETTYAVPIHKTNYGVTFQRSITDRLELAIGTHSIEKLKICLIYNLRINPITNEK